jgi:hypothetical protein
LDTQGLALLGLRVEMKDVLLAEWALLLKRNKARFNRADLDKISPQIRAALIEFQGLSRPAQATEPSRLISRPG